MRVPRASFVAALLGIIVAACGSGATSPPSMSPPSIAPTTASATASPAAPGTTEPSLPVERECEPAGNETWVPVDSHANLFGAGHDTPPAPGGGGGGVLPPEIELPDGGTLLVRITCTAGVTDCCSGPPTIGAEGFAGGETDVESFGGISGMVMDKRTMYLAGVFLTDAEPADPPPDRLDFTGNADFKRLEPEIAQTFFIGDGQGKTFVAPEGATRLFLGFVDGGGFVGMPGYYANNTGALEATVTISVD